METVRETGSDITAEVLESSAGALASATTALLHDRIRESATAGHSSWKRHLTHRILELAAAVRVDDAALFVSRIDWLRRAYRARGNDDAELRASIECLRDALSSELPKDLFGAAAPVLEAAVASFDRPPEPEPDSIDPASQAGRLALEYLKLCLEGEPERAIQAVIGAIENGLSVQSAYIDVLIPAQREAGQLWHSGDISIAEEHLISETTRQLLSVSLDRFGQAESNGKTMLAASVAGNAHDLGLRIVTNLFRLAGWRCLFLGADMPSLEIARAAQLFDVDLALLNATITTHLKEIGAAVLEMREAAPATKILVGGLAFASSDELWTKLGADGYAADAGTAVAAGNALVGI